jgi:hypothetical protein
MSDATKIAYLCPKRQVHVIDEFGVHHAKSQPGGEFSMAWWAISGQVGSHAWPTWSPTGETLASFHCSSSDQTSRVVLTEIDGICSEELAILENRLPIYLQWSDDSQKIAVLCQQEDQLQLSCVKPGVIGHETKLLLGSPMFFTWARDRIALFVGTEEGVPRLQLIDPEQSKPTITLPHPPGNFCTPLWIDEEIVYVANTKTAGPTIFAANMDGSHKVLETVNGLTALVASPKGGLIARAIAEAGDGTPYTDLSIIDLRSGETVRLCNMPCLAFFWSPTGDAIVLAHVNTDRNLLEWYRVGLNGDTTHLMDLHPTRDLGFYLRFFEQYCQSHQLIDSHGQSLVLTGINPACPERSSQPGIWRVPLIGGEPEEIAAGMFAVFAPT